MAGVEQADVLPRPTARAFLEKYLGEVVTAFPGRNIHLGLDESFRFGFCDTCRRRREEIGFGPLFTEYVKWASGFRARAYGSVALSMMIWYNTAIDKWRLSWLEELVNGRNLKLR